MQIRGSYPGNKHTTNYPVFIWLSSTEEKYKHTVYAYDYVMTKLVDFADEFDDILPQSYTTYTHCYIILYLYKNELLIIQLYL